MKDSVLSVLHWLRPRICRVRRESPRDEVKRAGFDGDTGRVIGFFTKLSNVHFG